MIYLNVSFWNIYVANSKQGKIPKELFRGLFSAAKDMR